MTTAIRQRRECTVRLLVPHPRQAEIIDSPARRKIIRAGRRGGKTVVAAIMAVKAFLQGRRVLYAAPTSEQTDKFWFEVTASLREPIDAKVLAKNETERVIERARTENRIKAKTAWDANTLRGDYADLLILDEWQLMAEDTWEIVGAPMLLDNNGDAVFIYTPPSVRSVGVSKARDPRHAPKMYKAALADKSGRWQAFHFTSHENPYISHEALNELARDMSLTAYRQEILAEDEDIPPSWLIYSAFDYLTNRIPRFPIPAAWLVYSGHDFGGANPAALFFAQDPATGLFYAFKEYLPGGGRSTAQHVEAFTEIAKGYNVIKRAGGSHQEDEIRQGYMAHGWPITEPTILGVNAGIDKVRGMMQLKKVFVFDDLHNLLEELATYRWKLDNEGKPSNEIEGKAKYHLCDCMRGILSGFVPETVVTAKAGKPVSVCDEG